MLDPNKPSEFIPLDDDELVGGAVASVTANLDDEEFDSFFNGTHDRLVKSRESLASITRSTAPSIAEAEMSFEDEEIDNVGRFGVHVEPIAVPPYVDETLVTQKVEKALSTQRGKSRRENLKAYLKGCVAEGQTIEQVIQFARGHFDDAGKFWSSPESAHDLELAAAEL
jgi:hypothetical protein